MTIKQQGGIFGRKPSFNTVEASASGNSIIAERTGSDGHIVTLKKDGTDVGYLQSRAGVISELILDPRSAGGAGLAGSGEAITPMDHSQQANNHTSLGNATYKWKNLYLSGNVIVDSGSGIDFSATSGTGTSELFDDYEEGTWTPTLSAYAGTPTTQGSYVKIGRVVKAGFKVILDGTSDTSNFRITGLPFSFGSDGGADYGDGAVISYIDSGTTDIRFLCVGTTDIMAYNSSGTILSYNTVGTSTEVRGVVIYTAA